MDYIHYHTLVICTNDFCLKSYFQIQRIFNKQETERGCHPSTRRWTIIFFFKKKNCEDISPQLSIQLTFWTCALTIRWDLFDTHLPFRAKEGNYDHLFFMICNSCDISFTIVPSNHYPNWTSKQQVSWLQQKWNLVSRAKEVIFSKKMAFTYRIFDQTFLLFISWLHILSWEQNYSPPFHKKVPFDFVPA